MKVSIQSEKLLKKCNITESNIGACLNGKQKTSGKHPITGERLHWKRLETMEK